MAAIRLPENGYVKIYDAQPWNWNEIRWETTTAPTQITYSANTTASFNQNIIWRQWYDAQTYSTTITNSTGDRWFVRDEDWISYGPIRFQANPVQERIWERWEVRERETQEQEAARLLREQERRDEIQRMREEQSRRRLAEQARIDGAQARALELLEMILSPEERLYRAEHGEIMVRGSAGGMYVIEERDSVHGNVRQVDEHGCLLGRICVAPQMYDREAGLALPLADGWVGQYLAIKHDELLFRQKGNWSSVRPCQQPGVPSLAAARAVRNAA